MTELRLRDSNVWLFNSAQFAGNPKWLLIHVTRHHPEIEAHWLADNAAIQKQVTDLGFSAITKASPDASDIMRRTGVWVVNQVKESIPADLDGAVLLNLWHGVGVKSIERGMNEGYLRERIATKYIRNNQIYRDRQLFLVTSPLMETHFRRYIGLDDETVIRGGFPQAVYPAEYPGFTSFDHDIVRRKGLPPGTRLALYAPTPRRESSTTFLQDALPDLPRLNESLAAAQTLLMIKMHPHMTTDAGFIKMKREYAQLSHVYFWDNAEDVYEIAGKIDLAIMDYSSILYDLMAAGVRNFVRYIFDYTDDGNDVLQGGELDYMTLSCGTLAHSFDDLVDLIGNDNTVSDAEIDRLTQTFWAYSSPQSLEHIVDRAREFTPRHVSLPTLYSYDVFDTVFHRRGVDPISVFANVQQRLEAEPRGFPAHLVRHFVEIRRSAERISRMNRRARPDLMMSGRLEVTLQDIYDRMQLVYSLTDHQLSTLMDWETECELTCTIANDSIIEEMLAHRANGDTVVMISDMYLPEETVRGMLHNADARLDEIPLFLSNTWQAQKTTRKLFLTVYDELGYDFAEWIHTGDNRLADVVQPARLGIKTRQLETPQLGKQEQRLVERCGTFDSYLVAGMLREARLADLSDVELFAIRHVAFYIVPYISWVLRDAVERGYRKLWFISRDGYHLQRIADAMIEVLGLDIDTGYIYGSRRAWRLASMIDEIDDDYFLGHGNLAGAQTIGQLLAAAEINKTEFDAFFPQHSELSARQHLSRQDLLDVQASMRLSAAYRSHLLERAAQQRTLAQRYFAQEVDLDVPHAYVEYWGRGYTQDCLVRILEDDAGGPVNVPFYYARSIYPSEGSSIRHNFTSSEHSLLVIEALFANLPHSTVLGYREQGDRIVPIVEGRNNDQELHESLERMLPQFARRYASLPVYDRDRLDRELFEFGFEHYSQKPDSKIYQKHVAHLRDSVTMGGSEREFAPAFTTRDFWQHLRGDRLTGKTTSMPLSMARTGRTVRLLIAAQKKIGFRRVVKRVKAKLRRTR